MGNYFCSKAFGNCNLLENKAFFLPFNPRLIKKRGYFEALVCVALKIML